MRASSFAEGPALRVLMARYSRFFYSFGWVAAGILAMVAIAGIGEAAAMPWLGLAAIFLVLVFTVSHMATFYWLAWGVRCPRLAAALFIPVYRVNFGWLVPIHNAMCRLRAKVGPGRELFRGITHLRQGELEQAVDAFEQHARLSPKELAGLCCAATAFAKLGRYGQALRYLDTAVRQGAHPDVLVFRCLTLLVVGATKEALQDIDAALLLNPKNPRYYYFCALALVQAGRVDEALEVLKGPGRPRRFHLNWWPLSVALQAKGDAVAAADARCRALPFLTAMRMLDQMPWNEAPEAETLARMGKLDQAEKAIIRTLARNPGDHEALVVEALLRALRGETEDAVESLEQAARKNPFVVVQAAQDPAFAPIAASPGFPALLERATQDWQARLLAIRSRPGIAQSGA